jgi:predicted permease
MTVREGGLLMLHICQSAYRQLRRSPGFAMAAILILAIGIGVTTAMYSILYAVVLQPLPFPQPDLLVAVSVRPSDTFSVPTMEDWQHQSHAFQSLAGFTSWSPRVESSAGVGRVNTILVTQNFIGALGVHVALGSDFTHTGQESDCLGQAIVSDAYWRRMGGSLAGRTLQLDHKTYTITGVLASPSIEGPGALDEPSILTPIGCDPAKSPRSRGDASFRGIGRLRSGVSIREAATEIATVQKNIMHDYPRYYPADSTPELMPLADYMEGTGTRVALFATMAACGTLLLISCANLTNLLLARNTYRRAEFALRVSLGATPMHLIWQQLVENCILALAGSGVGILLSILLVRVAREITVLHLPRLAQTSLNLSSLAFAGLVTIVVSICLTLLPAMRSVRPTILADLASGSVRGNSASAGLRRSGRLLVASQIAMALVLVASAGWMVSSVIILLHQPLGFDPSHLLIANTDFRGPVRISTMDPAKSLAILNQALDSLRGLPGVLDVAAANDKPLGGRVNRYSFCTDVHPGACEQPSFQEPDVFRITPTYFHTVGQELLRGRSFNAADDGRNHVAIVNRALAVQEWPGEDPVGHRIYSGNLKDWAVIVGEVGDVHSFSLERAPVPNLYLPEADGPDTQMTLMVRSDGDPTSMDEVVRRTLLRNGQLTVRYVESMPELMAHQIALRQFSTWVAVAYSCLALGLAILGTYALLSYEVSLRHHEVAVRLALGSTRSGIINLILRQELPWITVGMALGLVGAATAGFLLRAQFFHAQAASPLVLTASIFLFAIPAFLAVAIPARRASLLEPSATLHCE